MSTNSSFSYAIYTGVPWTDHGSGKLILTLSSIPEGFLQAFIPLFITFVGPMTWIIAKFSWYQLSIWLTKKRHLTRYNRLDYLQEQTLLRNSTGSQDTIVDSWSLFWAWKNTRGRSNLRIWFFIIFSFLFFLIWQMFGVLSAFI